MTRIQSLQTQLHNTNIKQLLITEPASIDYYIGQSFDVGERFIGLLVAPNALPILFLNRLFTAATSPLFEVVAYYDSDDLMTVLNPYLTHEQLGIDGHCSAAILFRLQAIRQPKLLENGSHFIDRQRAIKSDEEQKAMIKASAHNDSLMAKVREHIKLGISEQELASWIVEMQAQDGGSGISFEPIVSINDHIADPHATPTDRRLQDGDAIVVDMGGVVDGYCSDMTRTFYLGNHAFRHLYDICLQANLAAIAKVKAGVTFAEVDQAARQIITDAGYGEYFTHRTGHGIGKMVHEPYDVSSSNHATIEAGMIFSIEPGIYLPGQSGVRIEDLVIATETGCIVLNHFSKDQADL